jgi:hypothetical protein
MRDRSLPTALALVYVAGVYAGSFLAERSWWFWLAFGLGLFLIASLCVLLPTRRRQT